MGSESDLRMITVLPGEERDGRPLRAYFLPSREPKFQREEAARRIVAEILRRTAGL